MIAGAVNHINTNYLVKTGIHTTLLGGADVLYHDGAESEVDLHLVELLAGRCAYLH